jgi:hypothetical protein
MDFSSYLSGFTDGEGCFSVSFNLRSKFSTGIEVRPSFSISQHKRNLKFLNEIREYFKVGGIRYSKKDNNYKYEVRSVKDLTNKVIPHFEKYPLKSNKLADFLIFKEVCNLIITSKHLNKKYLEIIIRKSYKMNESGKRKYKEEELLKFLTR